MKNELLDDCAFILTQSRQLMRITIDLTKENNRENKYTIRRAKVNTINAIDDIETATKHLRKIIKKLKVKS